MMDCVGLHCIACAMGIWDVGCILGCVVRSMN